MTNISVIGSGYVGLVTGACLAKFGHKITCIDIDEHRVAALSAARMPFYEPGLGELVHTELTSGLLTFTSSYTDAIADADVVFVAVNTPSAQDGSVDLRFLRKAVASLGAAISPHHVPIVV